ncbi:hypothetical protein HanRHA438_Chr13g0583981 [Helianthus annuus]|nr:hypothetical protein HanRHA438_Chr13g0583981 [Helianthus annuus]
MSSKPLPRADQDSPLLDLFFQNNVYPSTCSSQPTTTSPLSHLRLPDITSPTSTSLVFRFLNRRCSVIVT